MKIFLLYLFLNSVLFSSNYFKYIIPGIAYSQGAYGSFWKSDVNIINPSPSEININCDFMKSGANYFPYKSLSFTVNALGSKYFGNILQLMGVEINSFGALICESDTPFISYAITKTENENGVYGQGIPAVDMQNIFGGDSELKGRGYFFPLKDGEFRTNIGLVNLSLEEKIFYLSLKNSNGNFILNKSINIKSMDLVQINDIYKFFGISESKDEYLEVSLEGEGDFTGYISVIDNKTQDPAFFLAKSYFWEGSSEYIIEASAEAEGAYGSRWRTSLWILNIEDYPLDIEIFFLKGGEDNTNPLKISFTLPEKNLKEISNIFEDYFQISNVYGALYFKANGEFLVSSRTFTGDQEQGTYGMGMDGSSALRPAPNPFSDKTKAILPLKSYDGNRLNIGILNFSPRKVDFKINVVEDIKNQELSLSMLPFESKQINNISNNANFLIIEPGIGSGPFFPYASLVNNKSNDGVFSPAYFLWYGANKVDTVYFPAIYEFLTNDWNNGQPSRIVSFGDPIEGEYKEEYIRIIKTFLNTPPFKKDITPSPSFVGWGALELDGVLYFESPTLISLPGYEQGPDYLSFLSNELSLSNIGIIADLETIGFFISKDLYGDEYEGVCQICPPPAPDKMPQIISEVAKSGALQIREEQFVQTSEYPYIQKTLEGCNQENIAYGHYFEEKDGLVHIFTSEEYVYYPTTEKELERQDLGGTSASSTGKLSLMFGQSRHLKLPSGNLSAPYAIPMDYCLNLSYFRAYNDRDILSLIEVWGLDFETLRERDWVRAFVKPIAKYFPPPSYRPKFNLIIDNPPLGLPLEQGEDFSWIFLGTIDAITNACSSLGMNLYVTFDGKFIDDADLYYVLTFGGYEDGEIENDAIYDLNLALLSLINKNKLVFFHPIYGIPNLPNWMVLRNLFGIPGNFSFINTNGTETNGLPMVDGDQIPRNASYNGKEFVLKGLYPYALAKANVIYSNETNADILIQINADGNPVPVVLNKGKIYIVNFFPLHLEGSYMLHQIMSEGLGIEPLWKAPGSIYISQDKRGISILTNGTSGEEKNLTWRLYGDSVSATVPYGKTNIDVLLPFTSSKIKEIIFKKDGNIKSENIIQNPKYYKKENMDAMNLIILLPE